MKTAIVHDYLNQYGGAEKVLEAIHGLFPDAPVYTSIFDSQKMPAHFRSMDIRTSFMQRLPLSSRLYRTYMPLYPLAFERLVLSGYDLVVSSSSAWAKGVLTSPEAMHICYCHSPMRFAWSYEEYVWPEKSIPLRRSLLPLILSYVRLWDEISANRVDHYIANSKAVSRRIAKYYKRTAEVINPPVDVEAFEPESSYDDYYLVLSRLMPYKRLDIVVEAFSTLGLPLKVIGTGRDHDRLKSMATDNVEFLGFVEGPRMRRYLARCRALLFPGEEDFGITAVEAQAAGRPVIAYGAGGALESVIDGVTGVFFDRQEPESVVSAVRKFNPERFDSRIIRKHAEGFGRAAFQEKLKAFIEGKMNDWGA